MLAIISVVVYASFMASNFSISIAMRPDANEAINKLSANLGMSKVEIVTRLVEWFALQPEEGQQAILGTLPISLNVDATVLLLTKMAREGLAGSDLSDEQIDEVEHDLEKAVDSIRRATIDRMLSGMKEDLNKQRESQKQRKQK